MSDRMQTYDMDLYLRGIRAILRDNYREVKEAKTVYDIVVDDAGDQLVLVPSLHLIFFNDQETISNVLQKKGVIPAMHISKDAPKLELEV